MTRELKNALLTEAQRKYLLASEEQREEEYTKQQRYYHRANIRDRVDSTMTDIRLLLEIASDEELEHFFDVEHRDMSPLVALLYRLAGLSDVGTAEETFRGWLQKGITSLLIEEGTGGVRINSPSVSFEVEEPELVDLARVDQKLSRGGPGALDQNELLLLLYLFHRDPESVEGVEFDDTLEAIASRLEDEWPLKSQLILPPEVYGPTEGEGDENEEFEEIDTERQAEAEEMAQKVLILEDLHAMERDGMSARGRLKSAYGIDPAEFEDEQELLKAVRVARNEDDDG